MVKQRLGRGSGGGRQTPVSYVVFSLELRYNNIAVDYLSLGKCDMAKIALLNAHTSYAQGADGILLANPISEYILSCQINSKIKPLLEQVGHEVLTVDTSTVKPYDESINTKARIVNKELASISVETHFNSLSNPSAAGMEILHGVNRPDSRELAITVMKSMKASLPFVVRRLDGLYEHSGIYILKAIKCPSIIVEVCFISNEEEMKFFEQPQSISVVGSSIATGILNYII